MQRQVAALQAELQPLREENLAQRQQPQGAAPAPPQGGRRMAGGAAAAPSSSPPSAVGPTVSNAASTASAPAAIQGCRCLSWTNNHDKTVCRYTCYRGARPSSYIFGYIKTRKFTYNIFKITCKNCVSFSPESALRRCLLPIE